MEKIDLLAWKSMIFVNVKTATRSLTQKKRHSLSSDLMDPERWRVPLALNLREPLQTFTSVKLIDPEAFPIAITQHEAFDPRCSDCTKPPQFLGCLKGRPGGSCLNCAKYGNGSSCSHLEGEEFEEEAPIILQPRNERECHIKDIYSLQRRAIKHTAAVKSS